MIYNNGDVYLIKNTQIILQRTPETLEDLTHLAWITTQSKPPYL